MFSNLSNRELILEVQNKGDATDLEVALVERLSGALDTHECFTEDIFRLANHHDAAEAISQVRAYTAAVVQPQEFQLEEEVIA